MKKKLLLSVLMLAILSCLFAVSAMAADQTGWGDTVADGTDANGVEYYLNSYGIWYSYSNQFAPDEFVNKFETSTQGNNSDKTLGFYTYSDEEKTIIETLIIPTDYAGTVDTDYVVLANGDGTYSTYPSAYIMDYYNDYSQRYTTKPYWMNCNPARLNALTGYSYSEMNNDTKGNGDSADSVVRIEIPEGVTCFEYNKRGEGIRFDGSPNLIEIIFPTTFGKNINNNHNMYFTGCTSLEIVDFSKAAFPTTRGGNFTGCTKLHTVIFPETITYDPDDNYQVINEEFFKNCDSLTSITIPDYIFTIGKNAFNSCDNLGSVDLGAGVKTLSQGAFRSCAKLETVTFSSALATTSTHIFAGCSSLKTLIGFENTQLKTIESNLFEGCNALTEIKMPLHGETVTINNFLWDKNTRITIYLPNDNFVFSSSAFTNYKSSATIILCGSETEASNFLADSTKNACGKLTSAAVSLSEYNQNTELSGYYFVYGANKCVVFYGEHKISGTPVGVWLGQKYISQYKVSCSCDRKCGEEAVLTTLEPLFKSNGFAATTGDSAAMMQSFAVNKALIEAYKPYLGD
ncbi:MAG: leucine-rich repeat domain-containing protein, partial [Clostridia bacterium]|nr:leucine-rich repeat domain-containing protein [Clostridia bacterium]